MIKLFNDLLEEKQEFIGSYIVFEEDLLNVMANITNYQDLNNLKIKKELRNWKDSKVELGTFQGRKYYKNLSWKEKAVNKYIEYFIDL